MLAARPRRGPPGAGSPTAGSSKARPNAGPGALTRTSRSGAVMVWAPQARVGRLVIAPRIRPATRRRDSVGTASAVQHSLSARQDPDPVAAVRPPGSPQHRSGDDPHVHPVPGPNRPARRSRSPLPCSPAPSRPPPPRRPRPGRRRAQPSRPTPSASTVKLTRSRPASRSRSSPIGARRRHTPPVHRPEDGLDPDRQGRRAAGRAVPGHLGARVSKGGEQGLLGLAFHPSFKTNRKFYVDYTDLSGQHRGPRVQGVGHQPQQVAAGLGPDDPHGSASRTRTTTAGCSPSGRDGYLYIGTGDGGRGRRPGQPGPEPRTACWARCSASTSTAPAAPGSYRIPSHNPYVGRAGRDEIWQRGPAQPVAVLVRPRRPATCGSATSGRTGTRRWTGRSARLRRAPGAASTGAGG